MTSSPRSPVIGDGGHPPTESYLIRRGHRHDLDAVLDLRAEFARIDADHHDRTTDRSGFAPLLDSDRHGIVWIAEATSTGVLGGYAVATWGWSIEIGGIEVLLDEVFVVNRGTGIGTRLIEALESDARQRGARRVVLETRAPNTAARRLYTRLGYLTDDSIWMSKVL